MSEERKLPQFGKDQGIERVCGYLVGPEEDCGRPAEIHVAWKLNAAGAVESGWACAEHRLIVGKYEPFQVHEVGPDCGMPGSTWIIQENRCECEEGLPVLEEKRRELVPA